MIGKNHRADQIMTFRKVRRGPAGVASRYMGPLSPFEFKRDGLLTAFRPQAFLAFMHEHQPHWIEEEILCEGLRAWVICPQKITGGIWPGSVETSSNDFILSSMALRSASRLNQALRRARYDQLISRDDRAEGLFEHRDLRQFPYDVFFKLGGLSAIFSLKSQAEVSRDQANQNRALVHVAALIHVLHRHNADRSAMKGKNRKVWGVNKAATEAAEEFFTGRRAVSNETISHERIKDHWDLMYQSAPLIYAATLVEDGLVFDWLMGIADHCFNSEGSAKVIKTWFAYADEIAATCISSLPKPLSGESKFQWRPLYLKSPEIPLPDPLPYKDFHRILECNRPVLDEGISPPRMNGAKQYEGW